MLWLCYEHLLNATDDEERNEFDKKYRCNNSASSIFFHSNLPIAQFTQMLSYWKLLRASATFLYQALLSDIFSQSFDFRNSNNVVFSQICHEPRIFIDMYLHYFLLSDIYQNKKKVVPNIVTVVLL